MFPGGAAQCQFVTWSWCDTSSIALKEQSWNEFRLSPLRRIRFEVACLQARRREIPNAGGVRPALEHTESKAPEG